MRWWQSATLRVIGWMLGIRGEAKIVYIAFDHDDEPTVDDIIKNQEEDEMNRQVDKEPGE